MVLLVTIVERKSKGKMMAYNVLTLCLMLTLTVTLADSVELFPPKTDGNSNDLRLELYG